MLKRLNSQKLRSLSIFKLTLVTISLALPNSHAFANDPTIYQTLPSAESMAKVLTGWEIGGKSQSTGINWKSIQMKPQPIANEGSAVEPGIIGFKVHFDIDSAQIHPSDYRFLDEVGRMMQLSETEGEAPLIKALVIEGHTDARGDNNYNNALSQLRANAVVSYLKNEHKVETSRLIPVGRGESELLDYQDPMNGINRRVQFYLPGTK